ncbi:TetR/AcrR family transcriptional regulator [Marinomonas algicola]|uniref:TetR/AcrR family transcriptional regulator n=1 Tax=Marinomonas algicola TaxID=2773454 RepID=UPI0017489972|nr:TetR/AcrR family transcriptional regulator [Marinomonas algicola]
MQMITQKMGVSVGTFYNYFDCRYDALTDLKSELTQVFKNDLDILLNTYAYSTEKITILIKYLIMQSNDDSTWSNYLYSGNAYSERLNQGIKDILISIITEGEKQKIMQVDAVNCAIDFIEVGLFFHVKNALVNGEESHSFIDLVLILLGVTKENREKVIDIICPITPLSQLPMSFLTINQFEDVYE